MILCHRAVFDKSTSDRRADERRDSDPSEERSNARAETVRRRNAPDNGRAHGDMTRNLDDEFKFQRS